MFSGEVILTAWLGEMNALLSSIYFNLAKGLFLKFRKGQRFKIKKKRGEKSTDAFWRVPEVWFSNIACARSYLTGPEVCRASKLTDLLLC